MKWTVLIANPAARALRRAPRDDQRLLRGELHSLEEDPYSGDTKMLRGTNRSFRRRLGPWRILFDADLERHLVVVTNIVRRSSHTY